MSDGDDEPNRPINFRRIYRQLMKEPFCLTPPQIDAMTLGQIALYGDLDGEGDQPTPDDIAAHCRASWPKESIDGSSR